MSALTLNSATSNLPSMKKYLPFLLLSIVIVSIAVATFVEDATSTETASQYVYSSLWFVCLWGTVVLSSIPLIIKHKLWKKMPVFLLHLSFVAILAGALTTYSFGTSQMVHLRVGEAHNGLRLDSFAITRYPGSEAPQNYTSYCTSEGNSVTISMNKPLTINGYRYYQTSFDHDLRGTVLTENHDPWGTNITYFGYAMLLLSSLWLLISRSGELKRLISMLCIVGAIAVPAVASANSRSMESEQSTVSTTSPHCMERTQADSLKYKQIIYNNRICPVSTLAHDFCTKLTGKPSFRGLSAEQVLFSWMLYADEWQNVDMIKVKDKKLLKQLGIKTKLARFSDFFDSEGQYKLLGQNHPDIDEKLGLILWLHEGSLLQPLPEGTEPLSDARIRAEVMYNEVPFNSILFMACLTTAIVAIVTFVMKLTGKLKRGSIAKALTAAINTALSFCTVVLLINIALRWYISGNIPLTNGFETMQFIALISLLIGSLSIIPRQDTTYIKAGTLLIAGFTLLVAHLAEMNPQITPLMPVLHSPWLSSHVSIIMISYALFAFMAINSLIYIIMCKSRGTERITVNDAPSDEDARTANVLEIDKLTILNRILLYPATLFLSIGIFLGAVWANQSWGSYWSWDPKESWALVSMLVYGIAFHQKSLPWLRDDRRFHLYILFAFLTILMTYFGVNYLMGGMHSYGK